MKKYEWFSKEREKLAKDKSIVGTTLFIIALFILFLGFETPLILVPFVVAFEILLVGLGLYYLILAALIKQSDRLDRIEGLLNWSMNKHARRKS